MYGDRRHKWIQVDTACIRATCIRCKRGSRLSKRVQRDHIQYTTTTCCSITCPPYVSTSRSAAIVQIRPYVLKQNNTRRGWSNPENYKVSEIYRCMAAGGDVGQKLNHCRTRCVVRPALYAIHHTRWNLTLHVTLNISQYITHSPRQQVCEFFAFVHTLYGWQRIIKLESSALVPWMWQDVFKIRVK